MKIWSSIPSMGSCENPQKIWPDRFFRFDVYKQTDGHTNKLTDRQPSKIIYRLSLILLSLNVLCMYEHNAHKYGYLFKGNVIEGIF